MMGSHSVDQLVVAAIDFGTTYSGYAYSFRDEHKRDPLQIITNNVIGSTEAGGLVTQKVPTVVLFNKERVFHSFGYDAENKYASLADDEEHKGGTVDITVHEVQEDSTIVELVAPSGGPWGGTNVDEAFFHFLMEIFTPQVIEKVMEDPEYTVDRLDLQRALELKKRNIAMTSEETKLTPFNHSSTASIEIYKTPAKQPAFTDDDGCQKVGEILMKLCNAKKTTASMINVKMMFGGAELEVEAQEEDTKNKVSAKFNFI